MLQVQGARELKATVASAASLCGCQFFDDSFSGGSQASVGVLPPCMLPGRALPHDTACVRSSLASPSPMPTCRLAAPPARTW